MFGEIETFELDEGMFQWGLYAAANRLPFLPTRAGLGSDVMRVNPQLKTVRSPYEDGEELVAMPAIELDVALIHMNRADIQGNGQFLGPDPFFDDLFCGAAKRRFMTCEKLVETSDGDAFLYDLAADPDLEPVISRLREALDGWMAQQGDRGVETENAVPYHKSVEP